MSVQLTNSDRLERACKALTRYRALLARHEAREHEVGIRVVSKMIALKEQQQRRYIHHSNLTINQAHHLYG